MRKLLVYVFTTAAFAAVGQFQPIERNWIQSMGSHSAMKNTAFYAMDSLLLKDSVSGIKVDFFPDVLVGNNKKELKLRTGAGILFSVHWKNKLSTMIDYRVGYANGLAEPYTSFLASKAYMHNQLKGDGLIYHNLKGRVKFVPNKFIEFQAGLDNIFIGEGDRSLFLGDHGIPSPFASLKASFWKLEYHFIQQIWREPKRDFVYSPKGNTSHYLSFKANKNFSVGVFETVVYDMKDTLYNRGFELEYLNPMIFLRPQEYAVGSSDNIVLGLHASYQWKKKMFYTQFVLDEFLLKEIKDRSRWWANKYGWQLGYKMFIDKDVNHWFLRSEFNLVRPFTYSQINPNSVYGNQSLPVAHPLGANFMEFYQEVSLLCKKWEFTAFIQVYLKGNDSVKNAYSNGGDIYNPYINRLPGKEYGYRIGGGKTVHLYQAGFYIGREVWKKQLQVFAEPRISVLNTEGSVTTYLNMVVGIQRKIGVDRRNY